MKSYNRFVTMASEMRFSAFANSGGIIIGGSSYSRALTTAATYSTIETEKREDSKLLDIDVNNTSNNSIEENDIKIRVETPDSE